MDILKTVLSGIIPQAEVKQMQVVQLPLAVQHLVTLTKMESARKHLLLKVERARLHRADAEDAVTLHDRCLPYAPCDCGFYIAVSMEANKTATIEMLVKHGTPRSMHGNFAAIDAEIAKLLATIAEADEQIDKMRQAYAASLASDSHVH